MSVRAASVLMVALLAAAELRAQQPYQENRSTPSLSQRLRAFRDSLFGPSQDNGDMQSYQGNGNYNNQGNGNNNQGNGNQYQGNGNYNRSGNNNSRQTGPRSNQPGSRNRNGQGMPQNGSNQPQSQQQQQQAQPPLPRAEPESESRNTQQQVSSAPKVKQPAAQSQANKADANTDNRPSSRRTAQPNYRSSREAAAGKEQEDVNSGEEASADESMKLTTSRTAETAARPSTSDADEVIEDPDQMVYEPKFKSSRRRARPQPSQTAEPDDDTAESKPVTTKSSTLPRVANSAKTKRSESGDLPRIEGPKGGAANRHSNEFVVTNRGPAIRVETAGPKRIMVGKPGVYKVTVHNSGDVAAEDITVTVQVPAWAEVLSAEATAGESRDPGRGRLAGEFHWALSNLDARGHEELTLQIVAHENRSFDLQVRWACSPSATQTKVEVQEARLDVELSGPREVSFGEKAIYKLTLSNSGTADAENVMVKLLPLKPGDEDVESHAIGRVSAGSSKIVEVELVARQDGNVKIQVQAEADGGLRATASESVTVRRAMIKVAIEAPKFRYAGAVATYNVVVSNPGNDPAREAQVTVQLPRGAQFSSCSAGGQRANNGASVVWRIDNLRAGEDRQFQVKCVLDAPGANRVQATAIAAGELTHNVAMTTQVEALADLTLDVNDPQGAVPVGEDVVYEVVVRNRGTKVAEEVEVTAAFSAGLEPLSVTGEGHKVRDNKVVFDKIATIAAGQERTLKIRAQAHRPGTHKVHVEVRCPGMDTALIEEETTRFYGNDDASADDSASVESPAESDSVEVVQFKPRASARRLDRSRRAAAPASHESADWAPARSASLDREPQRLDEPAELQPVEQR